jgi:RNA polymerase sigma-70 factor, ECF subfamily
VLFHISGAIVLCRVFHLQACYFKKPGLALVNHLGEDMNSDSIRATNRKNIDLVRRAQRGDADAFAALFHAHKMRIYSLCLRMTNNPTEAEDLAQDAFLQVFRKLATFRGDSALSTWLYRIAVNTVLMHFRRKSPRRVSLDEPYNNSDGAKPAKREYGIRDGRLETSVARSDLPEGYRAIFLLHEVDGYQHREIAKLLGCSVGTSKSQLHKAKLRIRELLTTTSEGRRVARRVMAQEVDVAPETRFEPMETWKSSMPAVNTMPDMLQSNA